MDLASLFMIPLVAVPHGGPCPDGTRVAWKGEELELTELRDRVGAAPVTAITTWAEWAAEQGYRFLLDDTGRVLLLVSEAAPSPARELKLIAATNALVDEVLPVPERPTTFHGGPRLWMAEWAEHQTTLDRETVVLLQLENHRDYLSSLKLLGATYSYLSPWASEVEPFSGYVVDVPPVAAWIRTQGGDELYHPDNELVNKLAQLLVLRRFGKLPHWLEMSLAWHFEYEIQGSLYAFPDILNRQYSADFFGWDDQLRVAFRKRSDKPLSMGEVAIFKEGAIDREAAACSWGLTRFLVREHSSALPSVLDRLAALFYEKGRLHRATYVEPIAGFQPSADDQLAVLTLLCCEDVLLRATEAFRQPRTDRSRKGPKTAHDDKRGAG